MIEATLTARISLPEYLVILRRRAAISQVEASEKSGVNIQHLQKLEVGDMSCRIEDIQALATLYQVSPASFLAVDIPPPETPENGRSQIEETS